MKNFLMLTLLWVSAATLSSGQTSEDTLFNFRSSEPVVIDGRADDACWSGGDWHHIDQVWIPYNAFVDPDDFQGRFKLSWDREYLYILVEVVDDSLSDDWSNPYEHWWDDDCLELFIDEDRSMGDHERNCNAFAYHVSLSFDALDLDENGSGINYRDHVTADMDTLGADTYLWEFAIRIYDESYNHSSPANSRVDLHEDKLMGLAIAYCDNDETSYRENFIGSMFMEAAHNNDMYRNADYFGPMVLVDPSTGTAPVSEFSGFRLYPVPAKDIMHVDIPVADSYHGWTLTVLSPAGKILQEERGTDPAHVLSLKTSDPGLYLLRLQLDSGPVFTRPFTRY